MIVPVEWRWVIMPLKDPLMVVFPLVVEPLVVVVPLLEHPQSSSVVVSAPFSNVPSSLRMSW